MDKLDGLPEEQASAIERLAQRYKVAVEECSIVVNCFGLPEGWASIAFPLPDGRFLAMGVSPEGAIHS